MSIRAFDATNAYTQALGRSAGSLGSAGSSLSTGTPMGAPNASFGDMLGEMFHTAVDASRKSEAVSAQSIQGKADLIDVATAVNNAEMAVETLVAVRDRVVSAYQEILRMPI
ncbi:flagellar hook-basal body complex protein FliE [Pedomonas mirosovicensis]|uniref:flagellar hook-basal body complex protein FliE n=1 Tax=Pedomonas mirosovicensis TaxID=2908641 RepID=UPI002168DE0C|nr:flagellar hook-basal body complex protein FliE [Pedomonas mirosovicensis]MCH8685117.1 flagellar hook-basal body complex protein FliE [Pedomonas mirosovicensis]